MWLGVGKGYPVTEAEPKGWDVNLNWPRLALKLEGGLEPGKAGSLLEAGKGEEQILSQSLQKGHGPADTLILIH